MEVLLAKESTIRKNIRCPACTENGHDGSGDHLIVFEDGGKFCNRAIHHKSGENLYIPPNESTMVDFKIDGKTRYTASEFLELIEKKKITQFNRSVVLAGMKGSVAWEVMDQNEKSEQRKKWDNELKYFNKLGCKNLVSRSIRGNIAALYNTRVGVNVDGDVERHYYPVYSKGELVGASCRTLPKNFRYGTLGRIWGSVDLFGQNTLQKIIEKGRSMKTLVITGGQCDAMAAQQMLIEGQKDSNKWNGVPHHVWSVSKGEKCMEQLLDKKEDIDRFSEILLALDHDDVGKELELKISRLFRGKCKSMPYPGKDPNECLLKGRGYEFYNAFWNPTDPLQSSVILSVADLADASKPLPVMGMDWPWPSLNPLTYGIQKHKLYTIGAGTGVGKTEFAIELSSHIADVYKEPVGAIYLENTGIEVVKKYAGKPIGKRLTDPPITDKTDKYYLESTDYTQEISDNAINDLMEKNKLFIANTNSNKDIETVLDCIEEFVAQGITNIVIDNLTAIKIEGKGNRTEAIDEAMRRLGTYKDENPVTLFLISHLKNVKAPRIPHEDGGDVLSSDFRGSGSIRFWSNVMFGLIRDTRSEINTRIKTKISIVKCRDRGLSTGEVITTKMDLNVNKLVEIEDRQRKIIEEVNGEEKEGRVTAGEAFDEFT